MANVDIDCAMRTHHQLGGGVIDNEQLSFECAAISMTTAMILQRRTQWNHELIMRIAGYEPSNDSGCLPALVVNIGTVLNRFQTAAQHADSV